MLPDARKTRAAADSAESLPGPEQCITVEAAVRAYTLSPAIACERGNDLGNLAPGKLADLVVMDQDIYKMDPMEIHRAKVDLNDAKNGRGINS